MLTVLAVTVIGLSGYFLSAGLSSPPGGKQPSLDNTSAPSAQEQAGESAEPTKTQSAQTPLPSAEQAPSVQTPAPSSATPRPDGQRRMTICAVGDISSGEFLLKAARTGDGYDYTEMFRKMKPYLEMQDYALASLGSTVSEKGQFDDGTAPVQLLDALRDVGFDVLALAGEHSLDRGVEGATETAGLVADAGFDSCGAYANGAEYWKPLILEGEDLRVAVLSYTANTLENPDASADVIKYLDDAVLQADMNAIRAEGMNVDFTIAMVRWGEDKVKEVTQEQKLWAQKLADAGVDVILGTHTQYLQPLEEITAKDGRKALVAYSLGNFLTQMRSDGRDAGAVLTFTLMKDYDAEQKSVEAVSYCPSCILRYSIAGKYHFEILPVNEYKQKNYENIGTEAKARILQITEEVRGILGETAGTLDESVPAAEEQ